ncbi:unnamed protein product [Prunus armeniaca]|uniref:Small ribosomal subunit protein uS10 domain-containing protein n=1 Tax=Prunus armeniaca TaxID=36596 RepID=A0A6J5WAR7_PRUAR|nr:hypothetical protein GBA52_002802 [Prunus armeniaca]CAB4295378.1 unnamed protein product [Prunus armeniaca]
MATVAPPPVRHAGPMMTPAKLGLEEPQEQIIRKIRITLFSRNVKILEKGTNTRDRFEMRVHKRVMDLFSTPEVVKHVIYIQMEAGVEVEVTIADA